MLRKWISILLMALGGNSSAQFKQPVVMTDITKQLHEKIAGLLYSSESDYPFELQDWQKISPTEAASKITAAHPGATMTTVPDTKEFFEKIIRNTELSGSEEASTTANRYRELQAFIQKNFDRTQIYRVGRIEISVYIVLFSKDGTVYVLRTTAVET